MTQRVDRNVVLDVLRDAEATIATGGWTQHGPAADGYGQPMLDVRSARAWSPIGALQLACVRRDIVWIDATAATALRAVQIAVAGEGRPNDPTIACVDIANANDALDPATGRAAVVRWFSTAIAVVNKSMRSRARGAA